MPITVNESGVLHELDSVVVNESGVLYELDTVVANESGVLKIIHNGATTEVDITWSRSSVNSGTGGCSLNDTTTFNLYSANGSSPASTTNLQSSMLKTGDTIIAQITGGSSGSQSGGYSYGAQIMVFDIDDNLIHTISDYSNSSGSVEYSLPQDGYFIIQTGGGGSSSAPTARCVGSFKNTSGEYVTLNLLH